MKRLGAVPAILVMTLAGSAAYAQPGGVRPETSGPIVTIVTATGVKASVTFQGDLGPNRMEGTLLSLPADPIRAREGKELREIPLRHLQELERTPLGVGTDALSTYSLQLFTGESYILQPNQSEPPPGPQPATITRTMQLVSVPQEAVVLQTALFGVVRIPFPRLLQLTVQPFRGALREVPAVTLPVQVLSDLTLQVPFARITNFRRDPAGGTTTVSFGNAEGASGRVKQMPAGTLVVRTADGEERRIPLSDIVQYTLDIPVNLAANPGPEGTKSP